MNNLRFLTRFSHGLVDYAGAVVLLTAPVVLNFQATSAIAAWLSIGAGVVLLTYSLLTDYSLSLKNLIPFKWHLTLDALAAIACLMAPFIFGFSGLIQLYFLANGALVLIAVLLTQSQSIQPSEPLS